MSIKSIDRAVVVLDYRTNENTVRELNAAGYSVIKTKPMNLLYDEVKGHTDMQLHFTGDAVICEPTVYEYYRTCMDGINVICGKTTLGSAYPRDIAYNTCKMGDYAVCKRKNTDIEILKRYERIIDIKQGYAKCSICVVNDSSVITSDEGVFRKLKEYGFDVLKIRQGYIHLGSMSGFIGGASGLLNENMLAFNGELKTHPDHDNIKAFCRNVGVEAISLTNGELMDIGSIIRIK